MTPGPPVRLPDLRDIRQAGPRVFTLGNPTIPLMKKTQTLQRPRQEERERGSVRTPNLFPSICFVICFMVSSAVTTCQLAANSLSKAEPHQSLLAAMESPAAVPPAHPPTFPPSASHPSPPTTPPLSPVCLVNRCPTTSNEPRR